MMATPTIATLPTELLAQVFGHLAIAPPSSSRLHDQPSDKMLSSGGYAFSPLKTASLVSKRWRSTALPILFRHIVWSFDGWDLSLLKEQLTGPSIPAGASTSTTHALPERTPTGTPLLDFLQVNGLSHYVDTLTLVVRDRRAGMRRLRETALGLDSSAFVHAENNARMARLPLADTGAQAGREPRATYNEDNNWLWRALFAVVDPRRFTIIASPTMLASLLSRMLFVGDEWNFNMPWHILSLGRGDRSRDRDGAREQGARHASPSKPDTLPGYAHRRVPCLLFTIRPWTSLLLNEGSSMRVYKTYEFFLRRPPSILGALLGSEEFPNDVPLIPRSVRDLSYVGIFPLSSHFNTLVQHLPRIDRLFVQLVPRNDILHDREEMRNIDPGDLWMERNTSYSMLMRELLDGEPGLGGEAHSDLGEDNDEEDAEEGGGDDDDDDEPGRRSNWRYLKEFESGDAADREAWLMAVEYVRVSGRGWAVERDGVFVKRGRQADDEAAAPASGIGNGDALYYLAHAGPEDDSGGEDGGELMFQGHLTRLAFNGTERLPFSSMWLYVHGPNDDDP